MKPVLYQPNETAFNTNGIGILNDAVRCTVVRELNGQYELTLEYPVTGIHFNSISDRSIILAKPDPERRPQPFRVYHIAPVVRGVATFYARHLVYDLLGIPASPFAAEGITAALTALKDNAVVECPFTFSTDKTSSAAMKSETPTPIWNLLGGMEGSILDTFGGEYEFDRFDVQLCERIGDDRGVAIRYGKNLTTLEQDRICADCYTGVYPYWTGTDGEIVELTEKVILCSGSYSYTRIMVLDLSSEWEEAPMEDALRERAEKYVSDNSIGVPKVSWKIEFIPLGQMEEYKWLREMEKVLLGDTVYVSFIQIGVDASSRVVAYEYDSILEKYNNITVGRVRDSLLKRMAQQMGAIVQSGKYISALRRIAQGLTQSKEE